MAEAARISATEAARNFSDKLNEVEHERRTFVISRQGRPVAVLAPVTDRVFPRRTWDEAVGILISGPGVDEDFERDLAEIRASVQNMPPDPWERS